jgi:hypothetical protein
MPAQPLQRNWETWIAYFEHNAMHLLSIDWDEKYQLTQAERSRITQSLQQFQLGESSEGKHVISQAQRYVSSSGDESYLPALRLFIKEEQRHAEYLGRFMQKQAIPLAHSHPVDSVFRFLRRALNLELSIMAMLTAEIIAVPYYRSVYDATNSPLLRQICRQLLRDEVHHLQFQLDALSKLAEKRSSLLSTITHLFHRILFAGTVLIVWQQHRPVLRSAHYTLIKFWRANWQQFNLLFANHSALYQETTL